MGRTLKTLFSILFLVGISLNIYCQHSGKAAEPGKCYAKCLMPEKFDTSSTYYYTLRSGVEDENLKLKTVKIKFFSDDHQWIKSVDLKDGTLNWYLDKNNPKDQELIVVKNWRKVDSIFYDITEITECRKSDPAFTKWFEVVCAKSINADLIEKIKQSLIEKRILPESFQDRVFLKISPELKEGLLALQRANGLPIGQLDLQTLEFLNIRL